MRKNKPNIRRGKIYGNSEKKSGFYKRKQIHSTEIIQNFLCVKINNFEIEIWDNKSHSLLFNLSCSHPARDLKIFPESKIALISSLQGQASSFWLNTSLIKTELSNYSPPISIKDRKLAYRDTSNNIIIIDFTKGSTFKLTKKCIFLLAYKKKIFLR